jgi:hypothetical protein
MYDVTARAIRDNADGPLSPAAPSVTIVVEAAFRAHERFLRGLCYG